MAQKRGRINANERDAMRKLRGGNLRKVLLDYGISQADLAEKLNYSKEHISYIVNGHRNLTLDIAEKIVELFPDVRLEWLMGYDNYRTQLDVDAAPVIREMDIRKGSRNAIQILAKLAGYEITAENHSGTRRYRVALNSEGYQLDQSDLVYIISKDGKEIGRCDDRIYHMLAKEVADFAEFKLQKLCDELGRKHSG